MIKVFFMKDLIAVAVIIAVAWGLSGCGDPLGGAPPDPTLGNGIMLVEYTHVDGALVEEPKEGCGAIPPGEIVFEMGRMVDLESDKYSQWNTLNGVQSQNLYQVGVMEYTYVVEWGDTPHGYFGVSYQDQPSRLEGKFKGCLYTILLNPRDGH